MKNFNKTVKEKFENFFDWIKGAKLIELNSCDTNEDPIRPELDVKFRTSHGRKIYGVKYKNEICAIMCFGFTNEIPKTIEEFDLMTKDAYMQSASWRNQNVGKIAIAYTVWSKKKGGGKQHNKGPACYYAAQRASHHLVRHHIISLESALLHAPLPRGSV